MKVIWTKYNLANGGWCDFVEEFLPAPHDVDLRQVVSVEQSLLMTKEEWEQFKSQRVTST